eukprot:TRINITY_DN6216_c0_g1_i2.p1 TRINITY_DN6216_c0_g1~~TRINITY_DN6216_c0_g1_i2.p1  ORF type:complete len:404 (+),score=100.19 TRINITY_DN6216_c0_g1_i2:715-1926(+)
MTSLSLDPRYIKIPSDEDRERLFDKFIDELTRKEQAAEREAREQAVEEHKAFVYSNCKITKDTKWNEYYEEHKSQSVFENVPRLEVLKLFTEIKRGIEEEEKEIQDKKLEEMEREDRYKRHKYRELLREQLNMGNINVKTRWNEFRPLIENDSRYKNMLEGLGSRPAELFYDIVEELEDVYHLEKKKIKEELKKADIVIDQDTKWETYDNCVSSLKLSGEVDPLHYNFIFNDLQEKFLQKIKKAKKKSKKKLNSFFKHTKLHEKSSWDRIKSIIPEDITDLTEEEKEEVFKEHMQKREETKDFDSESDEGAPRETRRHGSPSREREDNYHKYKHDKYDRNDKYRSDRYDKYDRHNRYDTHDRYDKHNRYDKYDRYDDRKRKRHSSDYTDDERARKKRRSSTRR